jgi:hypothetical protein
MKDIVKRWKRANNQLLREIYFYRLTMAMSNPTNGPRILSCAEDRSPLNALSG